jgi:hypothetical protein
LEFFVRIIKYLVYALQERAWYDNHREAILRGGLGEKVEEDGIDLFQYFSTSCYSGFPFFISSYTGAVKKLGDMVAQLVKATEGYQTEDAPVPGSNSAPLTVSCTGAVYHKTNHRVGGVPA